MNNATHTLHTTGTQAHTHAHTAERPRLKKRIGGRGGVVCGMSALARRTHGRRVSHDRAGGGRVNGHGGGGGAVRLGRTAGMVAKA